MFSTQEAFRVAFRVSWGQIRFLLVILGLAVTNILFKHFLFLRAHGEPLRSGSDYSSLTMFSTQEAFRENGVTAFFIALIAIALLLLGLVVIPMLGIGVKLLLLSLVWVALYYLQRVLVGKRRCSRDWYVQYTAMAAYYLPTPVALCAASALYHFPSSHIDEYTSAHVCGIVGMLFFTFSLSTKPGLLSTNMRAYSLGDRRRNRSDLLMWLVFLGSIVWEWSWTTGHRLELLLHMIGLCLTAHYILFLKPAYSTLDCETKAVADYMKRRKSSKSSSTSSPFFDANSNNSLQLLDCCRYPFIIRKGKEGEWFTVQDLFGQCRNLPVDDKEICLSYSLSRLLARRYYGFQCAEEGDDIVRRFVLADLGRRDGYDRAFRIVQVQLAFLHDYFFTASLPIIESGFKSIISSSMVSLGFGGIIIAFLLAIEIQNELVKNLVYMCPLYCGLCICSSWCVLYGTPTALLVENLVASYWRPIHTAFHNLKCLSDVPLPNTGGLVRLFRSSPSALDDFDPFQTQAGGAYWSNKIGQYSILQDFNRHRSLKKEIVAWFKGTILSEPSYWFIKHLPVEDEEVDIKNLDSIRKLVADTLWDIDGPPTNGTKSLKTNLGSSVYDWLWTCRQETHTHTILIWHIATCYCGISPPHIDMREEEFPLKLKTETFHEVAMALSKYCAYLVAFLPEFLPEHSLTTKEVFQRVLQEAKDALGSTHMEEKEKHAKIGVELPHPDEQTTTFHKGVWLGQQLEKKLDGYKRWKVMAEFWAETILYIAPSDNAEAHIEHLAKGGEFITHLWAMLSNAGILKRATGEWHPPPTSTTAGELCSSSNGPLTQTEITYVQTQGSIVPSNDEAPARSAPSTFSTSSSQRGQPPKYTEEEKGKKPVQ